MQLKCGLIKRKKENGFNLFWFAVSDNINLYKLIQIKALNIYRTNDFSTTLCEYLEIPPSDFWQMNSVQTQDSDKDNDCFKVQFQVLGMIVFWLSKYDGIIYDVTLGVLIVLFSHYCRNILVLRFACKQRQVNRYDSFDQIRKREFIWPAYYGLNTQQTQDVKLTSYVRSICVLCLGEVEYRFTRIYNL